MKALWRAGRVASSMATGMILVLVLTLLASAFLGPGRADAATAPAPRLWTYSGESAVDASGALSRLIQMRDSYCPAGKPIPSNMTLAQALASAKQVVVDLAGTKAVAAFEHSATARSAVQSRAAAAGMFAGKKTVAALLALLRTNELEPNDPTTLSSISALLNILNRPKESLAMAKAADALRTAPDSPMGISGQAVLLNNEGHAMLELRRWADAERLLRQSATLSPELSEAKVNLAIALLCQQEDDEAVRFFRAGMYRRPYHLVQTSDQPGAQSIPEADQVLDVSHGANGMFPSVRIPPTWLENNGSFPDKAGLTQWDPLFQEYSDFMDRMWQLDKDLSAKVDWAHIDPKVFQRFSRILILGTTAYRQPQIAPLAAAERKAQDDLDQFIGSYGSFQDGKLAELYKSKDTWPECHGPNSSTEACDARWDTECSNFNTTEHSHWLPLMQAWDSAARTYYRANYRLWTAIVSNLADPLLHRIAYVELHREDWVMYYQELFNLSRWAEYLGFSNCHPSSPTADAELDQGSAPTTPACPAFLKGVKFAVKIGDFVKFSANCEQFGLEVASKSDVLWVGGFAEASYNFVKGTGTIFAGMKGGGKIPETNVSVSAKEGLYLTIGADGIHDAGMRVSTTGSFGLVGGPTVDMKGFQYDISFVSQTITF
jgi:tetratricopeptide (TPR) repeat protein